jgi:AhpD family alkylhydroperoxidase
MTVRLNYAKILPAAPQALTEVEKLVARSTLDPRLVELVKLRSSQINGCAFCVDMHTKDARALEEEEQRLHLVAVWREAPCFSERERAALAWSEAITLLPTSGAPDDVYQDLTTVFSPEEIVTLTLAIALINVWNRLSVGFRRPAGDYVSTRRPAT